MEDQLEQKKAPEHSDSLLTEPQSQIALFVIWSRISASSFGGGVATLGLLRQEFIVKRRWISEDDFVRDWSLCQLAPGINLIAIVILIGRRLGGTMSIVAALLGLLLPSFLVTVGITAAYQFFSKSPFVMSARTGIVPAVAGVGLATAWTMLVPIVRKHWKIGWATRIFYALILFGCFFGFRSGHVSPVVVLLCAGAGGACFSMTQPKATEPLE